MKLFDSAPKILFSDNHLLVAIKPSGWLTQPDGSDTPNLEDFAKEWVKNEYKKPGNVFLHAIHRLDKPVSGLVLFGRTSKALSRLNESSRDHKIERFYLAEIEGLLAVEKGTLEHYLLHTDHRAIVSKEGKKAILHYRVIQKKASTTVIQIQLETGRYHQIRAQFSAIGHPIIGDVRYGATKYKDNAIELACINIQFDHPISKKKLDFKWL